MIVSERSQASFLRWNRKTRAGGLECWVLLFYYYLLENILIFQTPSIIWTSSTIPVKRHRLERFGDVLAGAEICMTLECHGSL